MADHDDPDPATADQPLHYGARLEQLERDMYEQARWVEGTVFERLGPMEEMWDTLSSLSNRMDNLEAYLGLQAGAQPVVLYNGPSAWVTQTVGGPSWRREQGLAERMDVLEDVARGLSRLRMADHMDADEDVADAVAAANPIDTNAEASLAMASADVEGLAVAAADSEEVAETVAHGEETAMAGADVMMDEDDSRPVASANDVLMEHEAAASVMGKAEQVEVALPASLPINIVPATPQDSQ